jgi:hypothetical protein
MMAGAEATTRKQHTIEVVYPDGDVYLDSKELYAASPWDEEHVVKNKKGVPIGLVLVYGLGRCPKEVYVNTRWKLLEQRLFPCSYMKSR